MAIVGITDRRAPAFPQIGVLRKGTEKQTNARGQQTYGKDLRGFRFDSDDLLALEVFNNAYGNEPRRIDVYLPYECVEENFETCKEAWSASALQHRCNGETCSRWLDKTNGKYSSESVPCPGGCKPVGRLKVILPVLKRMVYVVAETHSIHDLVNIQAQLEALYMLRGNLRGIPMVLSRSEREISTPRDGGRVRVKKWLLNIEAAPSWAEYQLTATAHEALPTITVLPALPALPAPAPQVMQTITHNVDMATGEAEPIEGECVYCGHTADLVQDADGDVMCADEEECAQRVEQAVRQEALDNLKALRAAWKEAGGVFSAIKSSELEDDEDIKTLRTVARRGIIELLSAQSSDAETATAALEKLSDGDLIKRVRDTKQEAVAPEEGATYTPPVEAEVPA